VRLVLLGDPVAHSRSPAIHRAALAAVGITGTYEARRVGEGELVAACAQVAAGSLDGANITMPWKSVAAATCDVLSTDAGRIGAVNTLVGGGGRVAGHLTDVPGLRSVLGRLPDSDPVIVLGSGATAAAALLAAEGRELIVVARDRDRAEAVVERAGVVAAVGDWESIPSGGILVNATPLGMEGEELPGGWLDGRVGLVDLPYGRGDTRAVAEARRRGITVADGIDALVAQAAVSFELWTGIPAPVEVMETAARQAVAP
jgi:shikimate dehydrogenase